MSTTNASEDSNSDFSTDTLDRAIVEYLEACESGNPPNQQEFLEKYVSVADRLREFFDNRQELDRMIKPIRQFQDLVDPPADQRAFGNYTLIREIGRGGMGVIYEARQQNLQRHVALKMIASHELRSENARRRFQVEAESASTLEHSNIVRIYDVGQVDDHPFFTMKLINGGSLRDTLQDGPLAPRVAAEVAFSIAKAVNYAHQRGILHRDLKPGNILLDVGSELSDSDESVDDRGRSEDNFATASSTSVSRVNTDFIPMISDFGLAKKMDEDGGMTLTGAVLGTPSFMSPEQASGGNRIITTATDTYGVGAILYNMLTGKPPFVGENPLEITRNVVDQPPSRIRPTNSAVDLDLETICLKCLEKHPQHRYETAGALADDLKRYLNGKPILARRSGAFEQVVKWARRNKVVAGMLTAIAALLIIGLVGSIRFSLQLSEVAEQRKTALNALSVQEQETGRQRDHALRRLFEAKSAEVAARRTSDEPGQRFKAVAAAQLAVEQLKHITATDQELFALRSETAGSLALADIKERGSWTAPTVGSFHYRLSPDLTLFAMHRRDGAPIEVYRAELLMETKSVDLTTPDFSVDIGKGNADFWFSSCGKYICIYTLGPDKSFLYEIASQKLIWDQPTEHPPELGDRDGKPIFIVNERGKFFIRDLPALQRINVLPTPGHSQRIRVSSDGEQLACVGGGRITVLSTRNGQVTWQQSLPLNGVDDFAWHPTEPVIAIPNLTEVQLWRVGDYEPKKILKGAHFNRISRARFSADGAILATSSWGQQTRFWDVGTAETVLSTAGIVDRFSTDGKLVAIGSSKVGIWNFNDSEVRRTVVKAEAPDGGVKTNDLAVHPNNRWVALAQENGVRLFDLDSGETLTHLPSGVVASVRFHPDGTKMYTAGLSFNEWPISEESLGDEQTQLTIGPPVNIKLEGQRHPLQYDTIDIEPTGQLIAINAGRTTLVSTATPSKPLRVLPSLGFSIGVSLSANGRFVAVGNHHGTGAQVFNGETGELVKEIATPTHTRVRLSPNGTRLAVVYNGCAELYDTKDWHSIGTWDVGNFEFGWPVSFSPDSKYLLLTLSEPSGTLFVEARSGEQLIRIPGQTGSSPRDTPPCLTTDGRLLMVTQGNGLEAWDIDKIRVRLRELGLDWNGEQIADSKVRPRREAPIVSVIWGGAGEAAHNELLSSLRGRWSNETARESLDALIRNSPKDPIAWHRRADLNEKQERWTAALADFSEAIRLGDSNGVHMSNAMTQRRLGRRREAITGFRHSLQGSSKNPVLERLLAWELCLHPDQMADRTEALNLATAATKSYPDDVLTLKVLGAAMLRADRADEAVTILRRVAPSVTGTNVADAYCSDFFLALAHAKLEEMEEARMCYDQEISSESQRIEVGAERVKDWMQIKRECATMIETKPVAQDHETVWFDAADLAARAWATQGTLLTQHFQRRLQGKADAAQPAVFINIRPKSENESYNVFWRNHESGGKLHVEFDAPKAGVYELKLAMVTARDYGIVEIEVNGQRISEPFDGHSPRVMHGATVVAKHLSLRKGPNQLTLANRGKSPRSAGYFAGIDSLQLIRQERVSD